MGDDDDGQFWDTFDQRPCAYVGDTRDRGHRYGGAGYDDEDPDPYDYERKRERDDDEYDELSLVEVGVWPEHERSLRRSSPPVTNTDVGRSDDGWTYRGTPTEAVPASDPEAYPADPPDYTHYDNPPVQPYDQQQQRYPPQQQQQHQQFHAHPQAPQMPYCDNSLTVVVDEGARARASGEPEFFRALAPWEAEKMYVIFTKAENTRVEGFWKNMIKRAVDTAGSLTHTELAFTIRSRVDNTKTSWMTCAIYYGKTVMFYPAKNYFTDTEGKWWIYCVSCNPDEMNRIYSFCADQRHKPFNSWGLWLNFLPWPMSRLRYDARGTAWMCSELVLSALQQEFPELHGIDACKTTPQQLYEYLRDYGRFRLETLLPPSVVVPHMQLV